MYNTHEITSQKYNQKHKNKTRQVDNTTLQSYLLLLILLFRQKRKLIKRPKSHVHGCICR